jgi:hypothetical protein
MKNKHRHIMSKVDTYRDYIGRYFSVNTHTDKSGKDILYRISDIRGDMFLCEKELDSNDKYERYFDYMSFSDLHAPHINLLSKEESLIYSLK